MPAEATTIVVIVVDGDTAHLRFWPRASRGETEDRTASMAELAAIGFDALLTMPAAEIRGETASSRTGAEGSYGERLYRWLFGDEATQRELFGKILPDQDAHDGASAPVRLAIRSVDARILGTPWHAMAVAGRRLLFDAGWTVMVQRAEAPAPDPQRPAPLPASPNILVVAPATDGRLATRAHLQALRATLGPAHPLNVVRTLEEMKTALGDAPDVVYFYGHGEIDDGDRPCLQLRASGDTPAEPHVVALVDLRAALREASPHLVYLNCCSGGRGGRLAAGVELWDAADTVLAHACEVFNGAAAPRGEATLRKVIVEHEHPCIAFCTASGFDTKIGHEWMSGVALSSVAFSDRRVAAAATVPNLEPGPEPKPEPEPEPKPEPGPEPEPEPEPEPKPESWVPWLNAASVVVLVAMVSGTVWLGRRAHLPVEDIADVGGAFASAGSSTGTTDSDGDSSDSDDTSSGGPPTTTVAITLDGRPAPDGLTLRRDGTTLCTSASGACEVPGAIAAPVEVANGECVLGEQRPEADETGGYVIALGSRPVTLRLTGRASGLERADIQLACNDPCTWIWADDDDPLHESAEQCRATKAVDRTATIHVLGPFATPVDGHVRAGRQTKTLTFEPDRDDAPDHRRLTAPWPEGARDCPTRFRTRKATNQPLCSELQPIVCGSPPREPHCNNVNNAPSGYTNVGAAGDPCWCLR